jgi:hypothetical protein
VKRTRFQNTATAAGSLNPHRRRRVAGSDHGVSALVVTREGGRRYTRRRSTYPASQRWAYAARRHGAGGAAYARAELIRHNQRENRRKRAPLEGERAPTGQQQATRQAQVRYGSPREPHRHGSMSDRSSEGRQEPLQTAAAAPTSLILGPRSRALSTTGREGPPTAQQRV